VLIYSRAQYITIKEKDFPSFHIDQSVKRKVSLNYLALHGGKGKKFI